MLLENGRYHYNVFGLHILSDIVLPELLVATDSSDTPKVHITLGTVPTHIKHPIEKTKRYQVANNQFLFQVPEVGAYYVKNGNQIIIEPFEQAEERFLRLFLLGTAFGALLMQRGILPIHGSAVVIDGRCVIFTGTSGVGKSTLLAAFRKRGYSFLTDDVAAVTVAADGVAWVHSAYPQQKLWRDSADTMGVDVTSLSSVFIGRNQDKFTVPIGKGFCPSPMPLLAVYELGAEACREVSLRPLTGIEKLPVFIRHTYRAWLLDGLGLKAEHFKHCATVADQVEVSRLTRPIGVFCMEEQIRLIEQHLAKLPADRAV